MRLLSFMHDGLAKVGLLAEDGVVDLSARIDDPRTTLADLLAMNAMPQVSGWAARSGPVHQMDEISFLPPIVKPDKTIGVGLNYRSHVDESDVDAPKAPLLFTRFADSVVGHEEGIVRPKLSHQLDYEGELAVVIGQHGRHVSRDKALGIVAGYSIYNDGSVRDFQDHTSQYTPGKVFWRSGSFGPFLVTKDEVDDPSALRLRTRLNGTTVQNASVGELIFDVPALIEYISSITPLNPGDVIVTGTPEGVGVSRTPQLWLKPGDIVEVEIDRLGVLSNSVIGENRD